MSNSRRYEWNDSYTAMRYALLYLSEQYIKALNTEETALAEAKYSIELLESGKAVPREFIVDRLTQVVIDLKALEKPLKIAEAMVSISMRDEELVKRNVETIKNALYKEAKFMGIAKVAEKIGMSQPTLSRIFTRTEKPRVETLTKIAKALGYTEIEIPSFLVKKVIPNQKRV